MQNPGFHKLEILILSIAGAGQKCSAASLAIVEKSIYENPNFNKQVIDAVQSLRVGPGYVFSTTVGPIIKKPEQQLERALTALDGGEEWLIKPNQIDEAGLMWSPGVKTGVKPGSWSHLNEWLTIHNCASYAAIYIKISCLNILNPILTLLWIQ